MPQNVTRLQFKFVLICCWPCVRLLWGKSISCALWDFDISHHLMWALKHQSLLSVFCGSNGDCAAQIAVAPGLGTVANSICILPWENLPWVNLYLLGGSSQTHWSESCPLSTEMLHLESTNKTESCLYIPNVCFWFINFLFESRSIPQRNIITEQTLEHQRPFNNASCCSDGFWVIRHSSDHLFM